MIKAVIRCKKYPIICSRQTGHSGKYCDGLSGFCDGQKAVLEEIEEVVYRAMPETETKGE